MTATHRIEDVTKVSEIMSAIEKLPEKQQRQIALRLSERLAFVPSADLSAAIKQGERSLAEHGGQMYSRAELERKVRRWARGKSF